jgi:hypothetical protein
MVPLNKVWELNINNNKLEYKSQFKTLTFFPIKQSHLYTELNYIQPLAT